MDEWENVNSQLLTSKNKLGLRQGNTQERFPVHGKVRFLKFMQMSIFEYSAFWLLGGGAKINTETMQTHRKDQEGKSLTDLKK